MDGGADAGPVVIRPEVTDPAGPPVAVAVTEAQLRACSSARLITFGSA